MLFNSYVFIFLFLPVTLGLYYSTARISRNFPIAILVAASLFFYGWWNPIYLLLVLGSVVFNYLVGRRFVERKHTGSPLLVFGLVTNLGLLGYFKYAGFFVANVNTFFGSDWSAGSIVLPLAISFFTFQQIAFLVDAFKGRISDLNPLNYILFVTFFPQLIAGPIVHHREMFLQFRNESLTRPNVRRFSVGLTIFFIGLFKKVVLADGAMGYVNPVFNTVAAGYPVSFMEAWSGVLFYSMQLYFDFSGYADMAIGGARLFGVLLPSNFHSPYQAVNIVDFWRRWHMTLSRFLREYLYLPLGGNRKGSFRRYLNLMITMLLGGLWHGAGWNFLIWGGLHGFYLVCNHAFRRVRELLGRSDQRSTFIGRFIARGTTFLAVTFAWVFFRAYDLEDALVIVNGMIGVHGIIVPASYTKVFGTIFPAQVLEQFEALAQSILTSSGVVLEGELTWRDTAALVHLMLLLGIVFWLPNTQQLMVKFDPVYELYPGDRSPDSPIRVRWRPNFIGCTSKM